jgi:hypothetical protein
MKIITQKVLDCDAPTITGRIYPRDMMQAAITEYMSQANRTGQLGFPEGTLVIGMDKVSHTVENLFFDGNALMAEIKLLDTPAGQILQGMIAENAPFRLAACGQPSVQRWIYQSNPIPRNQLSHESPQGNPLVQVL